MGGRNYNEKARRALMDEARYRPIPQCPSIDLDERCGLIPEHDGDHRHRSGRSWPRTQPTDQEVK